jgi:hypothetical protein
MVFPDDVLSRIFFSGYLDTISTISKYVFFPFFFSPNPAGERIGPSIRMSR